MARPPLLYQGRPVPITSGASPETQAECGLQAFSKMETCFSRSPSPSGRGCREAAGEGKIGPHPALRAYLLPEGEGDAPQVSFYLGHLCLYQGGEFARYATTHHLRNSDTSIDDRAPRTRWKRKNRIEIKFADFGNILNQARDAQQEFFDRINIGGRMPAIPFK